MNTPYLFLLLRAADRVTGSLAVHVQDAVTIVDSESFHEMMVKDTMDERVERASEAAYNLILEDADVPAGIAPKTWAEQVTSTDPEDIEAMRMLRHMARTMLEAAE